MKCRDFQIALRKGGEDWAGWTGIVVAIGLG